MHLMIALSLTLVCDRAFNRGDLTMKLFENSSSARYWAVHASEHVAHSVSGF